ncbi:DEAD/DEAH box helicase [Bifidobacterium choloepi]|uniref:ATP-dependent helicase n=1 Tax=Bifidobacterium choloepi TaxID=2614131 RepID=A0A6I5ND00_9BIFI|nr:DEAD/DEAH box helicase [Bifidobacterium choloepi]NEG70420.1 hypothetical protein [Bifidobacterium choloepi]
MTWKPKGGTFGGSTGDFDEFGDDPGDDFGGHAFGGDDFDEWDQTRPARSSLRRPAPADGLADAREEYPRRQDLVGRDVPEGLPPAGGAGRRSSGSSGVVQRSSRRLLGFMAKRDLDNTDDVADRRNDFLQAIDPRNGATAAESFNAAAGKPAARGRRKKADAPVTPGSIHLTAELTWQRYRQPAWSVSFRLNSPRHHRYVNDLTKFADGVRRGGVVSLAKGFEFDHSRRMFDDESLGLLDFIVDLEADQFAANGGYSYNSYGYRNASRTVDLSDRQLLQLLRVAPGGRVTLSTSAFDMLSAPVVDGNPDFGFEFARVDDDGWPAAIGGDDSRGPAGVPSNFHGYRLTTGLRPEALIRSTHDAAVLVRDGRHGDDYRFHFVTPDVADAMPTLVSLFGDADFDDHYYGSAYASPSYGSSAYGSPAYGSPVRGKPAAGSADRGRPSVDHSPTVQFVADVDLPMFSRTVLPQLAAPGLHADIPAGMTGLTPDRCEAEFYLDVDGDRNLVCRGVANYSGRRFDVFAQAIGLDGVDDSSAEPLPDDEFDRFSGHGNRDRHGLHGRGRSGAGAAAGIVDAETTGETIAETVAAPRRPAVRDARAEELVREAVAHYFDVPFPVARPGERALDVPAHVPGGAWTPSVAGSDDVRALDIVVGGVKALGSVGSVYMSAKFRRLTGVAHVSVHPTASINHGLLTFSAISDEIPASQIADVLDSYRRRKRFHRLNDGSFVDLANSNLDEFNEIAARYQVALSDLANGGATMPAFRALQLEEEDGLVADRSFTDYLGELRVVDPTTFAVPDGLDAGLRPYQLTGYRWLRTLLEKDFGGILADEMGLGKTVQTIALLASQYESAGAASRLPSLIVCPASLVYNWQREIRRFAPELAVDVCVGSKQQRRAVWQRLGNGTVAGDGHEEGSGAVSPAAAADPDRPLVVVTSYDMLRRDIDDYRAGDWNVMVLDEAQAIKNARTQVAKAVKSVRARHRFALTGTPIENRPDELWSIFDFLMPGFLFSQKDFHADYELPILNGDGDASAKLQRIIAPFVLRRVKKDVLTDLPDKIEDVIAVPLAGEQRKLYAAREKALKLELMKDQDVSRHRIEILAELTELRELCCDPRLVYSNAKDASAKLDAIVETVESCMESGQKVLIFSQFVRFLSLIGERLAARDVEYLEITGATDSRRRLELVDQFNGDGTPVFLISLKAGGTGLNLTGASVVIHADPWWNEAAQDQATDRAHRIGQTNTVTVYKIVAQDTIEERILAMQQQKSAVANAILGAADSEETGNDSSAGTAAPGSGASKLASLGTLTKDDLLDLLG